MTDVRELEQRWRVTRRLDDEVAWLRARLLVGQVTESAVELAAFAGSEAARELIEASRWRWPKLPPPDHIEQSLGPSDSRRWKLVRSSSKDSGEQLMARAVLMRLAEWDNEVVARALSAVAHASLDHAETPDPDARETALRCDRKLLEHGPAVELPDVDAQVMALAAGLAWHGEAMVRNALAREVAPWALGYGDPVRARVSEG